MICDVCKNEISYEDFERYGAMCNVCHSRWLDTWKKFAEVNLNVK